VLQNDVDAALQERVAASNLATAIPIAAALTQGDIEGELGAAVTIYKWLCFIARMSVDASEFLATVRDPRLGNNFRNSSADSLPAWYVLGVDAAGILEIVEAEFGAEHFRDLFGEGIEEGQEEIALSLDLDAAPFKSPPLANKTAAAEALAEARTTQKRFMHLAWLFRTAERTRRVEEVYEKEQPTHEMLMGALPNAALGFRRLGDPRLSLRELVLAQDDGAPTSDDAPLERHIDLRNADKIVAANKTSDKELAEKLTESYRSRVTLDMDDETANDIMDLFADSSSSSSNNNSTINNNNSGLRAEFTGQHTASATALLDSRSVLATIAEKTAQRARRRQLRAHNDDTS
jgi:hypothetical protein